MTRTFNPKAQATVQHTMGRQLVLETHCQCPPAFQGDMAEMTSLETGVVKLQLIDPNFSIFLEYLHFESQISFETLQIYPDLTIENIKCIFCINIINCRRKVSERRQISAYSDVERTEVCSISKFSEISSSTACSARSKGSNGR